MPWHYRAPEAVAGSPPSRHWGVLAALLLIGILVAACGQGDETGGSVTVYSGRSESLIGPLIERFEAETGITVRVRYGDTAAQAVALLEEGDRSPADVFLAQDAGALGVIEDAGLFAALPSDVLERVDAASQSRSGLWVGVSGRARVIVASTALAPDARPTSVFDLTRPEWRGRVGWAPTNGSFQAFVTAMREVHGEAVTEQWLRDMIANGVVSVRRAERLPTVAHPV